MSNNYLYEDCIDDEDFNEEDINLYPPSRDWAIWPEELYFNTKAPKQCRRCGKEIPLDNIKRTFCSRECHREYYSKMDDNKSKEFKNWLDDNWPYSVNKYFRI